MVAHFGIRTVGVIVVVVLLPGQLAAADETPLSRLDELTRAKVLMALLGLVVLGGGLIALVMMGGRYVRRLARHRVEPLRRSVPAGVPKRPVEEAPPEAPEAGTEPPRDEL